VLVARLAPGRVARISSVANVVVLVSLGIVVILALGATWRPLVALGGRAWLTCAAVALVAVAAGHVLGGRNGETRLTLAAFSGMRFPALALLLVASVPRGRQLVPVVLAYILTSALVVAVYGFITKQRPSRPPAHPGGLKSATSSP
jgi:BASS family bile acid:Na+ symporter